MRVTSLRFADAPPLRTLAPEPSRRAAAATRGVTTATDMPQHVTC